MSSTKGSIAPTGELSLRVIHDQAEGSPASTEHRRLTMSDIVEHGLPHRGQDPQVRRWKADNVANLWRGIPRLLAAHALGLPTLYGQLWLRVLKANGQQFDLGLVGLRVVTDDGAEAIVDAFQNIAPELELFRFHGIGTDSTAEDVTDAALGTELTTEYNPDGTRVSGTQVEDAPNIFETVGTNTVDQNPGADMREHGIFSQATVGGVLLDRTVFGAINLDSGDGIQSTYRLTITSGS